MLAGVAGGLGRYFGVDPVIFRIGFAVSVFFGGLGALAYLLLWLFVPTDGEPDRAQRSAGACGGSASGAALGLAFAGAARPRRAVRARGRRGLRRRARLGRPGRGAIVAIGVVLAGAAFRGGARWLIPPAVALAVGAGVAAAADLDFRGGIGEREYHPLSAEAIPADGYKLGVGRLVVDLRDLELGEADRWSTWTLGSAPGRRTSSSRQASASPARPTSASARARWSGERNDGFDVDHSPGSAATTPTPRLEIDANVDVGQLRVINSDTASVDNPGYGPGPFHEDTAPQRAAEARACATG